MQDNLQAIQHIAKYEAEDYIIASNIEEGFWDKIEEPMAISAVTTTHRTNPSIQSLTDAKIAEMDRKMTGLTTQFTKLMAAIKHMPTGNSAPSPQPAGSAPASRSQDYKQPATNPRPNMTLPEAKHSFTDDGVPICTYCNNVGHVQRHCRIRRRAMQAARKVPAQGGR